MSSSTGSVKNLNDSRVQALQALLNSVAPDSISGSQADASKLTTEQLAQLSDKLGEILGENSEILHSGSDGTKRNEKGELVNEDGLPIIDITEPLANSEPEPAFATASNVNDPNFLPLWALSSTEKNRRKEERNRILDLLEEEEMLEQAKEDAATREKIRVEMDKRKEAGKAELERLKRAKELQKKMGRALVRTVVEAKDESSQDSAEPQHPEEDPLPPKPKSGKNVSFADDIPTSGPSPDKGKGVDRGDVALGRLRSKPGNSLQAKQPRDTETMKMQVVERIPGAPAKTTTSEPTQVIDSDDESNPDEEDEEDELSDSSDDEGYGHDDDDPVEWEEDDLDYARHQREVALAYYEKRASMVGEVTAAMKAHSHEEDEWDQPDVPLDATLASAPPKPSVSKFKSSLVNRGATTTMASHSLGQAILPASQTSSLKSAIRMGKIEDGKLVGGDAGESDDDMDEEVRQIIELLKNGEATNIGPASEPSLRETESVTKPSAPKPTSKVSKFKSAMVSGSSSATLASPVGSDVNTPISVTERSSPKLVTPQERLPRANPIAVPTSTSRPPSKAQTVFKPNQPQNRSLRVSNSHSSTPRQGTSKMDPSKQSATTSHESGLTPESFHPVTNPFSNIIDSPSFLPTGITESPAFQSMIIDPSASSKMSNKSSPLVGAAASKPQTMSQQVAERPSIIMTAEVTESKSASRETSKPEKKQRVSRFLAERM